MEQLTESQKELIQSVAKDSNISSYDVEVSPGSNKGDNYFSITKSITIKDKQSKKVLCLFLKCAQEDSEALRQQIPLETLYSTEACCYETAFPAFLSLHRRRSARYEFPIIAKYYGKCLEENKEWIMLENFKAIGFKILTKEDIMDDEHVKLVYREYGKLHALSLAAKDQMPEVFEKIDKGCVDAFHNITHTGDCISKHRRCFEDVIKLLDDRKEIDAMEKFKEGMVDFVEDIEKEKTVLVHGDCWFGNILFKYEDLDNPKFPTKACFIDFQVARVASPLADLTYFLFTSSPRDIYDNFKEYLLVYHNSLAKMLNELGTDVNKVFPYSELERQWRKYCKFGLYLSVLFLKAILSDPSDVQDLDEATKSGHFMDAFNYQTRNILYERRIKDLVTFMVDNNFI